MHRFAWVVGVVALAGAGRALAEDAPSSGTVPSAMGTSTPTASGSAGVPVDATRVPGPVGPVDVAASRRAPDAAPTSRSLALAPVPCVRPCPRFGIDVEGGGSWGTGPEGPFGAPVAGNPAPLDFDALRYPPAWAGRISVRYRVDDTIRLEARATSYGVTDDTSSASGFFGTRPDPSAAGELSRPVVATFDEEATAWGAELIVWEEVACRGCWRFDVGLGGRYLSFEEIAHVDLVTTGPGPVPFADGFVDAYATSDWWGVEGCLAARADVRPNVGLSATLKALAGQVERETSVLDGNLFASGLHEACSSVSEFSWGAELELGARWRLTSCLSLTASVGVLVLDGVQRAHDAFDLDAGASGHAGARDDPDVLVLGTAFLGVSLTF